MKTFIDALLGTPWWVYILFAYILYIGIKTLKPQTISVGKMFIIPALFLGWSIWGLIVRFEGGVDILIWLIFVALGGIAGYGLAQSQTIRADHKKLLIRIPGSPLVLITSLVIFAIKYFFGYMEATSSTMSPLLHSLNIIAIGIFTGIFGGRTFCYIKKFGKAKPEKLKKS